MGFQGKILTIHGVIAILLLTASSASNIQKPEFLASLESFNHDIFSELLQSNGQKSIIYSPFSIQTCLAMTRMGTDGETAVEMDHGLGFTGQTPESVADNYHSLLAKYKDSNIIKVANKVYVKKDYELKDNYKDLLSNKFFSSAENIDFSQKEIAAKAMNHWVEAKTDNAIKDLMNPDSLSSDDVLVMLSAIHFSGKWATSFKKDWTKEDDFFLGNSSESPRIKVEMMHARSQFMFGVDHDMMAQIVILPYQDSDLSMVLFAARTKGFEQLIEDLKDFKFQSLRDNKYVYDRNIDLFVPKFKAEFEVKLNDVLKNMGMKKMFENADFGKMLKSSEHLHVSEVVHKATIDVTEEGTEAAAATAGKATRRQMVIVKYNRPFVYAIINSDYVPLFQGTFTGY